MEHAEIYDDLMSGFRFNLIETDKHAASTHLVAVIFALKSGEIIFSWAYKTEPHTRYKKSTLRDYFVKSRFFSLIYDDFIGTSRVVFPFLEQIRRYYGASKIYIVGNTNQKSFVYIE